MGQTISSIYGCEKCGDRGKNLQSTSESPVRIRIGSTLLEGNLSLQDLIAMKRLVIFAHGSGSGRFSPRNNHVAEILQQGGISTLLFDLLTEKEGENYETRFDVDLLAERLEGATMWARQYLCDSFRIGYFGASRGGAAALRVAAHLGTDVVSAVVSRGGRPDLVSADLPNVKVPTLLIVGSNDTKVLKLNRSALFQIGCTEKKLTVIPRATHLFEEPGALDQVAKYAMAWFEDHL
jgi:putative phosphoribosyl transferase